MDKILVFIPAYNCQNQITRVLEQQTPEIKKYITETIVINNRSTDDTEAVVKDWIAAHPGCNVTLLRNEENYGLGGSHKVAFRYAKTNGFDYVIVLHGDDQGHIDNLLPYLENGEYKKYDCFLGARFMKGSVLDGYSKFRTFGNRVYDALFAAVVHRKIYDLGSGLNMYSTKMLEPEFYLQFKDNLMFNYCMILGTKYHNYSMQFFPIRWSESDQVSNVKMVNQAFTVLGLLWQYMVNKKKFINTEHRDNPSFKYQAEVVAKDE